MIRTTLPRALLALLALLPATLPAATPEPVDIAPFTAPDGFRSVTLSPDGRHLAVGALELKFWQQLCTAIDRPAWSDRHWSRGEAPGSERALALRKELASVRVQGGNTGLVGGQIPQGEVLLSTERLNRVREVEPFDDVVVAEAGVTLAAVHEAAAAVNRSAPLAISHVRQIGEFIVVCHGSCGFCRNAKLRSTAPSCHPSGVVGLSGIAWSLAANSRARSRHSSWSRWS